MKKQNSCSRPQHSWDKMKMMMIYNQENAWGKFKLELAISEYTHGNKSIQEYFSGFMDLWTELKELFTLLFLMKDCRLSKNIMKIPKETNS